ncbi:MAG: hypothetical protein AAGA54_19995 [Myxococcota bacterium]
MTRRQQGVLRWVEPGPVLALPASSTLERDIERTVRAADVAWSYYDRLFTRGPTGESPFQVRRARLDAAQRRFRAAAAVMHRSAAAWLANVEHDESVDVQSKVAVRRVSEWFDARLVPTRWPDRDGIDLVEGTVDVLENALANLRRRRAGSVEPHPYRRSFQRQDVTGGHGSLPTRQPSPVSYAPPT